MSRPNRFERRLAERQQARQATDREQELAALAEELRALVRRLAGPSDFALVHETLIRAEGLLGPDTPNTNTSVHVTGARGDS